MYSKDQTKVLQAVLSKFGPLILDFKTGRQRRIMNTHELGLGGELRAHVQTSLLHLFRPLQLQANFPAQRDESLLTCSSAFFTQPYQPWVVTSPPPFPGTITALVGEAMNIEVPE